MGNLNIYACNGVGSLNSIGQYRYWTAGTTDYLNTRSFNECLSKVNESLIDYELAESDKEAVVIANDIDLHICILQALAWNVEDSQQYPLSRAGLVLNKMLEDGVFDSNLTDDSARGDNLEEVLRIFAERMQTNVVGTTTTSGFLTYWHEIERNNVNDLPDEAKDKLNIFFASNRGVSDSLDDVMSLNPADFSCLADYVKACGAGFLYLWIDDISKYSATIRARRRKEEEVFEYICNVCNSIYSSDSVKRLLAIGVKESCKSSPEKILKAMEEKGDKLKYLRSGGVGVLGWDDILYIIAAVLIVVATTLSACMEAMQQANLARYQEPIDYESGIPSEDDFGIAMKQQSGGKWWLVLLGIGALAFLGGKSRS